MSSKAIKMLEKPLSDAARSMGLTLWDIEFVKDGASWYLRLYIDKDGGVGIDDCENYSRTVDPILDELDVIDRSYCLEVSSPGVERELKTEEHINAFLGSKAVVRMFSAIDGKKEIVAEIKSVDSENLTVTDNENEIIIPRKNISKINLYFDFGGKSKK